jgi:hypothetical protein
MTITEARMLSLVAFGNKYRLELIAALGLADPGKGISLTLLATCCGAPTSAYYPPVKAMERHGMVQRTGRIPDERRVLYARTGGPVWTGFQQMAENLGMDVDLGTAALDWPVAS